MAGRSAARGPHGAVVDDIDRDGIRAVVDPDPGPRRLGVFQHVGQRFLHDALHRQFEPGWQRPDLADDGEVDVQARGANGAGQPVERGD